MHQFINFYLSSNIHKLFFVIGAYCIFSKKENGIKSERYLRQLWTYTNPQDADAIIINQVPVSSDIEFLFNLLFFGGRRSGRWYDEFSFGGYHGSKIHIYKYMILLLTYLLEYKKKDLNISVSSKTPLKKLEYSYEFSDRYLKEVDDLIKYCEMLINEAEEWNFLYPLRDIGTSSDSQIIGENTNLKESEIQKPSDDSTKQKLKNTVNWLENKRDFFKEKMNEITSLHPLDPNKIKDCKNRIFDIYEKESEIPNAVSVKVFNETKDKNLEFVQIGYRPLTPKRCYLKSDPVDCSNLWWGFVQTVADGELNYFLEQINVEQKADIVYLEGDSDLIETMKIIESSIESLKNEGFSPSTIFLPFNYLTKLKTKNISQISEFDEKIRGKKYILNSQAELEIIYSTDHVELEDIIILDKKSCDWTFKPNTENDGRLWVDINEYEKDKSKIDLSIKTFVNLTIKNLSGIQIIRFKK